METINKIQTRPTNIKSKVPINKSPLIKSNIDGFANLQKNNTANFSDGTSYKNSSLYRDRPYVKPTYFKKLRNVDVITISKQIRSDITNNNSNNRQRLRKP